MFEKIGDLDQKYYPSTIEKILMKIYFSLKQNRVKKVVLNHHPSKSLRRHLEPIITEYNGPKEVIEKRKLIEELEISEGTKILGQSSLLKLRIKKLILPESLEIIEYGALRDCKHLEEVVFKGNNLHEIDDKAFAGTKIKKIVLPNSIEILDGGAFEDCKRLKEIVLPNRITEISGSLLSNTKITKIIIPEKVETIRYYAFSSTNLKEVTLPHSVKRVENGVFSSSKIKKLNIGPNITTIENDFLKNSNHLKTIEIEYPNKQNKMVRHQIKSYLKPINQLKADENGYIIIKEPIKLFKQTIYSSFNIISKEGNTKMNTFKLLKLIPKEYRKNIHEYEEMATLLPKWFEAMERRKKGNQKVLLPSPYIIKGLPQDSREIVRFYLKEKEFTQIQKIFGGTSSTEHIVKMCYHLGLFSDKKEESKRAYDFIVDTLSKQMNFVDVSIIFEHVNKNHKYNRDFAKFYIENFKTKTTFSINNKDYTTRMLIIFKEITDNTKNYKKELNIEEVVRYLSSQKFEYKSGNEVLAMTVSPYANFYNQRDFNRMQELYEEAKQNGKKLILQTKDKTDSNLSYMWSPADNPINFVLGHEDKADCCAKLNGAAENLMIASIKDPEIQNLIIFDGFKNIIGKATAYYNPEGKYMIFNNAEINKKWYKNATKEQKEEALKTLQRAAKDQATAMNKEEINITKITIGMRFNDLEDEIKNKKLKIIKDEEMPKSKKLGHYSGDANSEKGQALLYEYEKK